MSGDNKSRSIGVGQEFSQYRSYQPGDDLRQLDWKMFGRTERYYIKQSEIETNVTVKFIVDTSLSMSYQEEGMSKLQYAKITIAALAYLARKQGDAFGLFALNNKKLKIVLPRFEQQQFIRFLTELIGLKSEGLWPDAGLEQIYDHRGKEMIIFFTDLYDQQDDILQFIARLKTSRNEVIVFHLLGRNEAEFNFNGSFTFEDIETGERTKVNTLLQKEEYRHRMEQWLSHSRSRMLEKQIDYHTVYLDQPVEAMLRNFLTIRKRMLR
ncbi:MAG: DUF58 domain-containing protein [Bacteroidetes bacterium]|nr:DUF58 domain-containing protein [Bacteroidota bacterium]MBS1541985.1 DUF58 domain-containing protein [Bacteroidota bacterium]